MKSRMAALLSRTFKRAVRAMRLRSGRSTRSFSADRAPL